MPRLQATVTTTTKQEVTLKPVQKVKLRKALKVWAELNQQAKALKAALAKQGDLVEAVRAEVGADKFAFESFKITRVKGHQTFFDKEQFVRKGGDLSLYNECQDTKPKKEYTKITAPGEKEEE
jgi:hypothetical protein